METKRQLLEPGGWSEILNLYAYAMRVAVALLDADGQLVGTCHNPQPIWSLARAARPEWGTGCLFCLEANGDPSGRCTAIARARQSGVPVLVHDRGGFAHVALPLSLGDRHLGILLAGQVFDRYPEPLALDRIAKEFGLSAQRLWNTARHQVPVSSSNLGVYGSLLHTLGEAVLGQRQGFFLKRQLATTDAELLSTNLHLERANRDLLAKVEELHKSNGEKVVLMQEVHHRVNNNLQVIGSLLRLQAESSEDEKLAEALRTTTLRIDSMALIHAQLYETDDLREVDFGNYAARLGDNLFLSYGIDRERIKLSVDMNNLRLAVYQAIPAGLILSELVSNALKYAFPEHRRGSIWVEGVRQGERVEISVRDDGVGLPQQPAPRRGKSRGLEIVKVLCSQLHGTLEQNHGAGDAGPGAVFRISFPAKVVLKASV